MSKVLESLRADPVKPKKWGEGKRRKRLKWKNNSSQLMLRIYSVFLKLKGGREINSWRSRGVHLTVFKIYFYMH